MNTCRWPIALALAAAVIAPAAPAWSQAAAEQPERSSDAVLLLAEIKLLKTMFNTQRQQMDEMQKRLADLTAQLEQLRGQLAAVRQAQSTAPSQPVPPGPTPEPVVRPALTPRPPVPAPTPRQGPTTDFANLAALLNAIPAGMLEANSRMTAAQRMNQSRQLGPRYSGRTIAAEMVVTSVRSSRRDIADVAGTSAQTHGGAKLTCNLVGTFSLAGPDGTRQFAAGKKIAFAGTIADVSVNPAPAGRPGGATVQIRLTGCRLIEAVPSGRTDETTPPTAATFASVAAMIQAIPAELKPAEADTPEQAQEKKTQLEAWVKGELPGKTLKGQAMIMTIRRVREGLVEVRLYYGTPQRRGEFTCQLKGQFAGAEATKVERVGRSGYVELFGEISSASIRVAGSQPRIDLDLEKCRVLSSSLRQIDPGLSDPRPPTGPGPSRPRRR